jgi:hypothetical protein
MARAHVVQRHAHAESLHLGDDLARRLHVGQRLALGDLHTICWKAICGLLAKI